MGLFSMSVHMFLALNILTTDVLGGDCGLFSVRECNPSEEDLAGAPVHLPCEGIYHDCVRSCQILCSFTSNCDFFSYNIASQTCTLINQSADNAYFSTCDVLGGPPPPSIQQCSATAPEEDCTYQGTSVLTQT